MSFPFDQNIVWQPDPEQIKSTNLQRFMTTHHIASYDELLQRSTDDIEWFWDAVLRDLEINFTHPYSQIIDSSRGIQMPQWCVHGRMNIVHNCLEKWIAKGRANAIALIYESENEEVLTCTYGQLCGKVNSAARILQKLGMQKGDVVGLFMPMIPELIFTFLAVIKLGGIILPLFSGYGQAAISSRMADAGARFLVTVDGTKRRGKPVHMKTLADAAVKDITGFHAMLVVNHIGLKNVPVRPERDYWWHELADNKSDEINPADTAAEDPLMLIYTSGTTGRPKGAVHTHCGFPIKAAQDMYQCMDLKQDERMYWMTDMGWMMGPWLVFGTLLIGATMVIYDGAPDYPQPTRLWQQIAQHKVTHLGVSPTLIRSLKEHGTDLLKDFDFSILRMIGSTGSPWDPESWLWLFTHVLDSKKPILNYSGGTEISGGIVCGNFFKPLKPCAFAGPVPGMDADVINEQGESVKNQVGELIIRKPWIGMTRGFWKDTQRYLDTYWNRFSDVWVHGDFAAIDADGLWYILGRSDDTIKVAGKRIGPAEVEAILNTHPAVTESAVIGVPHEIKGEELVCFCVLNTAQENPKEIQDQLNGLVTNQLGKPLKPGKVLFVSKLPKTRNAKIMHRIIRATYLGQDAGDTSSLEDPAVINVIKNAIKV